MIFSPCALKHCSENNNTDSKMMKNKYQSTMPENAVTAADKQERINEDTIIVFSVCILSSRHKRDHELSE